MRAGFLAVIVVMTAALSAFAQAPEIENQWVRVTRVQQQPHSKAVFQLPSVLVYVTGPKSGKVEWLHAG